VILFIPSRIDFQFSTYEIFKENLSQVNWLDPDDIERYSEQEKENNLQYFCKP